MNHQTTPKRLTVSQVSLWIGLLGGVAALIVMVSKTAIQAQKWTDSTQAVSGLRRDLTLHSQDNVTERNKIERRMDRIELRGVRLEGYLEGIRVAVGAPKPVLPPMPAQEKAPAAGVGSQATGAR